MKALLCKEFSAVENLTWEDVPDPYPQDGEVIIEIKAAALNFQIT